MAIATVVFYTQLSSVFLNGSSAITGAAIAAMFGLLVIWALGGFLMVMVEGATGATIGNAAVRIRTVSATTGKPPGFGRAFGRRFVEQLGSLVIFGAPVIAASSTWDPTQLRQGWQDKAAGTTMVEVGPRAATSGAHGATSSAARAPTSSSPSVPGRQHAVAPRVAPRSLVALQVPDGVVASGPPEPRTRMAGGLIASVPGFEPDVEPVVPITNPASAPVPADDLDEDLDHTRMSPCRGRRTGSYQLLFDTGEIVIVDGMGLVGRNPAPSAGERVEHLIPIIDLTRSVSKTHLVFGAGPDGFWVSDRDSTNGTRTVSDDGVITEAPHDVKVSVPVGGTVEFGERRFTVGQL